MSLSGIFSSKTILGAIMAAFAFISQPSVLALLSPKLAGIIGAIGGLLAVFGLRSAIATNGVAATPSSAAASNGSPPSASVKP